jgi:hypothetical protein
MAITHTPDPIVDPERLFEGFENLMPFRVREPLFCGRKLMQCHPERSGCFAKRSRCGVEGPLVSMGCDECRKAFSHDYQVKFPARTLPGLGATGSFDCVVARFANVHFAQDDKS